MTIGEGSEKLAKAMLKPINPAAIIILGVYTVVWGFWVANPFWSVFSSAKIYSALLHTSVFIPFVPVEVFWGCLAITCGLVTIYGAFKRGYRSLVTGSAVAGWHWFMIGLFYMAGDWTNTGGITSLTFAVYAAFIYLNLRVNRLRHKPVKDMFVS